MQYKTVNGCTHTPSVQQILTLVLYLVIVVLHSIYIVPGILAIKHPILYVMMAMHYILLFFIIYDYIWITVHDPVDRILLDGDLVQQYSISELQDCKQCGKRRVGSYHCRTCNRCTQGFDHHCKFLNNCIGKYNYQNFIRLLSLNVIFMLNLIGQAVWVFVMTFLDEQVKNRIPKSFFVVLVVLVLAAAILILISILLFFHCYISCCEGMTTLQYIFRDKGSKDTPENPEKNAPEDGGQNFGSSRQLRTHAIKN